MSTSEPISRRLTIHEDQLDVDPNNLGHGQQIPLIPLILVHGGAGPEDPRGEKANQSVVSLAKTLHEVSEASENWFWEQPWNLIVKTLAGHMPHSGQSALAAVALLERDPLFNAGFGAALQMDGVARVSASYMDSVSKKFSAVTNVPDCLHPSVLAGFLQGRRHSMLDSAGAQLLMGELQIPRSEITTLPRFEQWAEKRRQSLGKPRAESLGTGTVGAVVIDSSGSMAAVTSTGGVGFEPVGRMGDTATVSGNYVTESFACSCTGYGEQINDLGFSVHVAARIAAGQDLSVAFRTVLTQALERGFGLAAICAQFNRKTGKIKLACGTTEDYFVWAYQLGNRTVGFQDLIRPSN